ncbi:MAG: glycoside hydrolase family 1 protein [Pyrinomonadaceae bacterium]|nr:glycoside hydrolase family 1 protein [Pyrinomonadaceae bacterium]
MYIPESFIWAGGIEDTFVPQTRPGHRALDEYELMGHYEHWREDLQLAPRLGLSALRWGIPWYKVEPELGKFDWSWTDKVLPYLVEELKIEPIIDLVHYGCPFWMKREFASKDYPRLVARYAQEFAKRYGKLVKFYTPLNEPIINALMCGLRGLWAPYLHGENGYLKIMMQIARGIVQTVKAIREVDDDTVMVYVEATGLTRAIREDLNALALEETRRGYLCFDLITGRVTPEHPLFLWLLRNGVTSEMLADLNKESIEMDVVGMNFYPQWSTKQVFQDKRGRIQFRDVEPEGNGFAELIESYYHRYQTPIMITETSAVGADEIRSIWLESSLKTIKGLREKGVPVIGYTWFPIFTMIDWRYRFSQEPLENFYLELGAFKLNREKTGERWLETPLVAQMNNYIANSSEMVGELKLTQD